MKLPAWIEKDVGKLLIAGIIAAVAFVLTMVVTLFIDTEWYKALAGITVGHLLFGRAAGLSVAFAMGLSVGTGVLINFLIESVMVMIVYPLFILSWTQLVRNRYLQTWIEQARGEAMHYHDKIKRYGMVGLFVFVWFPFWMTGPVIGAIIGYLIGLRHRVTLMIVLSGTLFATVCWALFLEKLQVWIRTIDPLAPWYIVLFFITIGIGVYLKKHRSTPR